TVVTPGLSPICRKVLVRRAGRRTAGRLRLPVQAIPRTSQSNKRKSRRKKKQKKQLLLEVPQRPRQPNRQRLHLKRRTEMKNAKAMCWSLPAPSIARTTKETLISNGRSISGQFQRRKLPTKKCSRSN